MYSFRDLARTHPSNAPVYIDLPVGVFSHLAYVLMDDKTQSFELNIAPYYEKAIGMESKVHFNKKDFFARVTRDEIEISTGYYDYTKQPAVSNKLTFIIRIEK